MGKASGKNKKSPMGKLSESGSKNSRCSSKNSRCSSKNSRCSENSPKVVDEDDAVFIELSQELKEEGTRLFQRRDYEGAAFKYDKAIRLLPKMHIDIAYLHSNIAACYMHMSPEEYHRAIDECNLALDVSPKYSKALLKRARCFEALNRLDLACRDVDKVLSLEPNNITALEISERVKLEMEEKGIILEKEIVSLPEIVVTKEKTRKKKSLKHLDSSIKEEMQEKNYTEEKQGRQMQDIEGDQVKHDQQKQEIRTEQEKHPREKQVRDAQDNQEKHTEKKHVKDGQDNQEKHAEKKEVKHGRDEQEKHPDEKQMKNGQGNQEKDAEKNKVKHGGDEKEKQTKEKQVNSQDIQEKQPDKNQGGHTKEKQDKHIDVEQVSCGEDNQEKCSEKQQGKQGQEKHTKVNKEAMKSVKLVVGEDIRCAQIPANCSLSQLRAIVRNKFPCLKAWLVKYKDKEDDLVTITSSEELRWAEELADPQGPLRLYVMEVDPEQELGVSAVRRSPSVAMLDRNHHSISENGSLKHDDERNSTVCVDNWMVQFARLFRNHVGFDSDAYLDLHDLGTKLYYEAMEDTVTSEEAQEIFQVAEVKFQEMAALALFNWGNVHMSRARKRLFLPEEASMESILAQVKAAYEWACAEYVKAGKKYEEAIEMKPEFFESFVALGQQQFEQAKLSWYYGLGCKVDSGTEVLELFNHAEDNMEKGIEIWEGIEYLRLRELSKPNKERVLLENMGLDGYLKDLSVDEAFEQASNMRSQMNILWGTILYERSVVEYKLGLPSWEECLTEAIEKFKIGGASLADISVMIKNHCVNETTQEGLSFKIDEIVQAWNEMYDAKKWRSGVPSFRLEPLFRRRPPKLHHILEHIQYT